MATHEPSQKTVSNIDGFQVIRRLDEHERPNRFLVRRSDGAEAAVLKLLPPESAESQILHQVNPSQSHALQKIRYAPFQLLLEKELYPKYPTN